MSCCRSRGPKLPRSKSLQVPSCANCHRSLRQEAADAIVKKSKEIRARGLYSFTAEIRCPCGFVNRIPLSFTKQ